MKILVFRLFVFPVLLIISLSLSHFAEAAVWYVKPNGSDSATGQSWSEAFQSIQAAVDAAAVVNDEIWVKQGIYQPLENIQIDYPITIYGGFSGVETEINQRDWQNNETIVDGNGAINHCFYINSGPSWSAGVVIDGFIITGGYADSGGGIYIDHHQKTTIRNCTFTGNIATEATYGGGAIFINFVDSPKIINCSFFQNSAVGNEVHGGAIYSNSSNPEIRNCLFETNIAGSYGGAIFINGDGSGGPATIQNATFSGNSAWQGGAIYNANSADPSIVNSIFWGNTAEDVGDAIRYDWYGSSSVNYCDVQGGGTPGSTWFQNGTGNFSFDPLFIDADSGNYHLMPNSPCIDSGDDAQVASGAVDFDGDERIIGNAVDLGVDESYRAWHVDAATGLPGNGSSWLEPFLTIESALEFAQDSHQIWVKGGLYNISGELIVSQNVGLYGGFAGTELRPDQRDWRVNATIIDGQDQYRCLNYSPGGDGSLDGFVIQNGSVSGDGAGILLSGASPVITNSIFRYNYADGGQGGAVSIQDGASPSFANCVFHDNSAGYGGAVASNTSSPQIRNSTFFQNTADLEGGAIWNVDSDAIIVNSIVWSNTAITAPGIFVTGTPSPLVSFSDVQDWMGGGTGNIDLDPLFLDNINGDFHLKTTSPCIDQGDNNSVAVNVIVDMDGEQRTHDGNEDGLATVDMGADEYLHVPVIWYVDGTLAGAGDGISWATAFNTIEAGIDNPLLRNFDQIWVKAGRYIPPEWGYWEPDGLKISKAIRLYGGFPSHIDEPVWNDRNWDSYPTVIDANTPSTSFSQRCIQIVNEISSLILEPGYPVIDGFTITGGDRFYGGGIYSQNRAPLISNCRIIGNKGLNGGGLHAFNGYPYIINNLFVGNSADTGSALYLSNMTGNQDPRTPRPRIINNTFTRNIAYQDDIWSSTVWFHRKYESGFGGELANNIFWNNTLAPEGAEVFIYNVPTWTDEAGAVSIHHNIIQNGSLFSWFNNGTNGTANIDGNPRFYDPDGPDDDSLTLDDNDYRPTSYLSVNNGDDMAVLADSSDLDGDGDLAEPIPFDLAKRSRYTGKVDIGAYEPLDGDNDSIPDIIDGAPAEPIVAGDFNNSGGVPDLADLITVLQTLCKSTGDGICFPQADTNGDERIGLEDGIYILLNAANQ